MQPTIAALVEQAQKAQIQQEDKEKAERWQKHQDLINLFWKTLKQHLPELEQYVIHDSLETGNIEESIQAQVIHPEYGEFWLRGHLVDQGIARRNEITRADVGELHLGLAKEKTNIKQRMFPVPDIRDTEKIGPFFLELFTAIAEAQTKAAYKEAQPFLDVFEVYVDKGTAIRPNVIEFDDDEAAFEAKEQALSILKEKVHPVHREEIEQLIAEKWHLYLRWFDGSQAQSMRDDVAAKAQHAIEQEEKRVAEAEAQAARANELAPMKVSYEKTYREWKQRYKDTIEANRAKVKEVQAKLWEIEINFFEFAYGIHAHMDGLDELIEERREYALWVFGGETPDLTRHFPVVDHGGRVQERLYVNVTWTSKKQTVTTGKALVNGASRLLGTHYVYNDFVDQFETTITYPPTVTDKDVGKMLDLQTPEQFDYDGPGHDDDEFMRLYASQIRNKVDRESREELTDDDIPF